MSVLDLFRLDGKTALVTGGGRGLGKQMAAALSEAGANVVVCSRKVEACQEVAEELRAGGGGALALRCDVTSEEEVEAAADAAEAAYGAVDVVVNNAGATWGASPEEMPAERVDRVLAVNVRGTFLVSRAVGRRMIERGRGGSIVNIASVAALQGGRPGVMQASGYSASKGAVISLTRDLAGSWAHHGIRVNAIAPGWFPTKMSKGLLEMVGERILEGIPLRRFGGEDDLKGAVLLLASSAGAYITGQTLVVDGGATIW